jgi:hypothetical protein
LRHGDVFLRRHGGSLAYVSTVHPGFHQRKTGGVRGLARKG